LFTFWVKPKSKIRPIGQTTSQTPESKTVRSTKTLTDPIKFYYERILGGQRKVYYIDRPRREKTLPTVLSEEKIVSIITSIDNIKHKAILMTIYPKHIKSCNCKNRYQKESYRTYLASQLCNTFA